MTNALKSIVEETNTYPKIIQADNGSEFMNETSDWMKENNIVYIKTLSYTPTSTLVKLLVFFCFFPQQDHLM